MVACNLAHFSTLMGHFHGSGLLYDVMQEKEPVAPLHLEDGLSELKPTASPSKLTHTHWKSKHTLFSPTLAPGKRRGKTSAPQLQCRGGCTQEQTKFLLSSKEKLCEWLRCYNKSSQHLVLIQILP